MKKAINLIYIIALDIIVKLTLPYVDIQETTFKCLLSGIQIIIGSCRTGYTQLQNNVVFVCGWERSQPAVRHLYFLVNALIFFWKLLIHAMCTGLKKNFN